MMHLKPTIPMLQYSNTPFASGPGDSYLGGRPVTSCLESQSPKSAGGLRRKSQIFPNSTP